MVFHCEEYLWGDGKVKAFSHHAALSWGDPGSEYLPEDIVMI